MTLWYRLRHVLTPADNGHLTFKMDVEHLRELRGLAKQEGVPVEQLAAELLVFALGHRQLAEANLTHWRTLSPREQQVAALICLNCTNRQIAARLVISPETVKTHVRNILHKFGLHSKVEMRQALADWDFSAWEEALPQVR